METNTKKISSFSQLIAWQKGHVLVLKIYKYSKKFPKEELFSLTNQIQRAVVSYTSNIAEGFVRHSPKEKINFYFIALGSITEVQNQLLIARDLKYLSDVEFDDCAQLSIECAKLINSLINSQKNS